MGARERPGIPRQRSRGRLGRKGSVVPSSSCPGPRYGFASWWLELPGPLRSVPAPDEELAGGSVSPALRGEEAWAPPASRGRDLGEAHRPRLLGGDAGSSPDPGCSSGLVPFVDSPGSRASSHFRMAGSRKEVGSMAAMERGPIASATTARARRWSTRLIASSAAKPPGLAGDSGVQEGPASGITRRAYHNSSSRYYIISLPETDNSPEPERLWALWRPRVETSNR